MSSRSASDTESFCTAHPGPPSTAASGRTSQASCEADSSPSASRLRLRVPFQSSNLSTPGPFPSPATAPNHHTPASVPADLHLLAPAYSGMPLDNPAPALSTLASLNTPPPAAPDMDAALRELECEFESMQSLSAHLPEPSAVLRSGAAAVSQESPEEDDAQVAAALVAARAVEHQLQQLDLDRRNSEARHLHGGSQTRPAARRPAASPSASPGASHEPADPLADPLAGVPSAPAATGTAATRQGAAVPSVGTPSRPSLPSVYDSGPARSEGRGRGVEQPGRAESPGATLRLAETIGLPGARLREAVSILSLGDAADPLANDPLGDAPAARAEQSHESAAAPLATLTEPLLSAAATEPGGSPRGDGHGRPPEPGAANDSVRDGAAAHGAAIASGSAASTSDAGLDSDVGGSSRSGVGRSASGPDQDALAHSASSKGQAMFGGLELENDDEGDEEEEEEGALSADSAVSEAAAGPERAQREDGINAVARSKALDILTEQQRSGSLPVSTSARLRLSNSGARPLPVGLTPAPTPPSSSHRPAHSPPSSPDAGPSGRNGAVDYLRSKKRHYFIISNSGRPIYSRHGEPHEMAALSALLYGLVSLSQDAIGEVPHVLTAGDLTICIRARPVADDAGASRAAAKAAPPAAAPARGAFGLSNVAAITVTACRGPPLPDRVLRVQLELLHLQLLAWTTAKYERALMDNPTLDTAHTLTGTAASFEALLKRFASAMDYVVQAAEMLRLAPLLRGAALQALQQAVVDSGSSFAVLACGHQLVAVANDPAVPAQHHPHPWDLLILLNFVASNPSFRADLAGQQAWVPLCLPKSSPHCFNFVYVHFPSAESPLFVAVVAKSQEKFFDVHRVREALTAVLDATGVLQAGAQLTQDSGLSRLRPADVPFPAPLAHLQPLLYHATIVRCATNTFVQTAFAPVLAARAARKAAIQDCMRMHASVWGAASVTAAKGNGSAREPMPIQWRATRRWVLLAIVRRGEFEAYAVLDPLTTKHEALQLVSHVVRHVLDNAELWQHGGVGGRSGGQGGGLF